MDFNAKDLENRFTYHEPKGDTVATREWARKVFHDIALGMHYNIPQSRELSLCITSLETAMFWANAAVARMNPDGTRL